MTTQTAELKTKNKVKVNNELQENVISNELQEIEENQEINFLDEIEWIPYGERKGYQRDEEPLNILVYFTDKFNNTKNGRITFSRFLSEKLCEGKRIKFGSLKGKVIFNLNETDGYSPKVNIKKEKKSTLSTSRISEIIFERFNLPPSNKSTYFRLKDLGNDFYLIDEIIK